MRPGFNPPPPQYWHQVVLIRLANGWYASYRNAVLLLSWNSSYLSRISITGLNLGQLLLSTGRGTSELNIILFGLVGEKVWKPRNIFHSLFLNGVHFLAFIVIHMDWSSESPSSTTPATHLHQHRGHAVTDEGAGDLVMDEFVSGETGTLVVRPRLRAVTV